jgi:hypothetical protein
VSATIVVAGNPVDGYRFVGPWQRPTDAARWAENRLAGATWWAANLEVPVEADDVVH